MDLPCLPAPTQTSAAKRVVHGTHREHLPLPNAGNATPTLSITPISGETGTTSNLCYESFPPILRLAPRANPKQGNRKHYGRMLAALTRVETSMSDSTIGCTTQRSIDEHYLCGKFKRYPDQKKCTAVIGFPWRPPPLHIVARSPTSGYRSGHAPRRLYVIARQDWLCRTPHAVLLNADNIELN